MNKIFNKLYSMVIEVVDHYEVFAFGMIVMGLTALAWECYAQAVGIMTIIH